MKPQSSELELHSAQTAILHTLLFQLEANFTQLNTTGMSSDHFNFHVQRLQEVGLIAKTESGGYTLTTFGKEFANRYDTENRQIEKQAKVAVLLSISKVEQGVVRHLIQKRLKQPYYGFHGRPTGKIKWGEEVLEAAARELYEETGLTANLRLVGVEHKVDRDEQGKLLEDKYFFIVEGVNPNGEFQERFEGGENYWMTKEEVEGLTEKFGNLASYCEREWEKQIEYFEHRYTTEKY